MALRRKKYKPVPGSPGYEDWKHARNMLRIRRSIGVGVILSFVWGAVWLVMFSGYAAPIVELAQPAVGWAKDVIDNPAKAWTAAAIVLISHIGLFAYIFDEI